ncbi:hypothetical protein [Streptomyces sp. NPDC001820]|uniref:hypothetical protein n=1 Tax=Streptomyces sp. NPDC001820 TaxID=3364613 RepID=UPI0036C5902C
MLIDPTDPETFEAEPDADIVPHQDGRFFDSGMDSANEADRAEQSLVVELHDDEYR